MYLKVTAFQKKLRGMQYINNIPLKLELCSFNSSALLLYLNIISTLSSVLVYNTLCAIIYCITNISEHESYTCVRSQPLGVVTMGKHNIRHRVCSHLIRHLFACNLCSA